MQKNIPNLFILLLSLLSTVLVYGQRPNTKVVSIGYIQPPSRLLDSTMKSYYVDIESGDAKFIIPSENEKWRIHLYGYQRAVSIEEADMVLSFTVASVEQESEVKEVTYKQKINDSTSITKQGGVYKVNAYLISAGTIRDIKNDKPFGAPFRRSKVKAYVSQIFNTYNRAIYAANESSIHQARRMYKELYEEQISAFNGFINDYYGFPPKRMALPIARGKGRKYDYSDLANCFDTFSALSEAHTTEGLSNKVVKGMSKCIEVWNKAIQEYEPGKRKTRIGDKNINHISFNVAVAYFMLRKWDKVYACLEKIKGMKGVHYNVIFLENKARDLERRYSLQE